MGVDDSRGSAAIDVTRLNAVALDSGSGRNWSKPRGKLKKISMERLRGRRLLLLLRHHLRMLPTTSDHYILASQLDFLRVGLSVLKNFIRNTGKR